MQILYAVQSNIGQIREENQDAYLVDEELKLFLVADGMGGMVNGKEAAEYTVKAVADFIRNINDANKNKLTGIISNALASAGAGIFEHVGEGSGSTIVAALLKENKVVVANLGDSSGYLLRQEKLSLLTKEHNLANLLVEGGRLDPIAAKEHHTRHQLTAFIGMNGKLPVHVAEFKPLERDRLLLCSDGLNSLVLDKEIEDLLNRKKQPDEAVQLLINSANEAGGYDNITALLIDIVSLNE